MSKHTAHIYINVNPSFISHYVCAKKEAFFKLKILNDELFYAVNSTEESSPYTSEELGCARKVPHPA